MQRRKAMMLAAGTMFSARTLWSVAEGIERPEKPARRSSLGLVIYCLGHQRRARQRQDRSADLFDPQRFLQYCHNLGAGGVQVPLGGGPADEAQQLRRQAEQYGMFIEAIVTMPRTKVDLERFEAEIRTAVLAGARAARTVLLPGRRYERFQSVDEFRRLDQQARRMLEMAAPLVEKHRLPLAVENHKDHRTAERVQLFEQIASPFVGACVDTGNNLALLEDPVEVVRKLAPWAFSVHLKDQALAEYEEGFLLADVPLGQGCLDLKTMVADLRAAKPHVRFTLELITRDPLKVPCLAEQYWAAMGNVPGSELARTLRMVRQHAAARLPEVSNLSEEQRVALEAANVKESLRYAREELGL